MTESEQARIKAAKAAVKAKEIEWSNALRNGCSPSRTELAKTEIEKFLRENLTEDFTNIDYVGQLRTKKDDIKNCVGGDYKVKSLTKPVFVRVSIHGRCAVVVGKEDVYKRQGMEREEVAAALGLTVPTVKRDLRLGEAWLRRFLGGDAER